MSSNRLNPLLMLVAIAALSGCNAEGRLVETFHDSMTVGDITLLDIGVESGDLIVIGEADADEIEVQVDLLTSRNNEDRDDEARHDLGLELRDMADGTALLTVRDPEIDRYWADVTVSMPEELELIVLDESGDVRVEGCASLTVDDASGDLTLKDISGEVLIEDGGGDLELLDVAGNVTIDDGGGDTWVENVDGDVEIDDGAGGIDVAHVTGKVTIRDGGGDIVVTDAESVEIESDTSGSVSIH